MSKEHDKARLQYYRGELEISKAQVEYLESKATKDKPLMGSRLFKLQRHKSRIVKLTNFIKVLENPYDCEDCGESYSEDQEECIMCGGEVYIP